MTAPGGALAALSSDLAQAVAQAGESVVYVDANPRRDLSGIVWDEHTIVTVDHTLEAEDDIELLLAGGAKANARLVGRDATTDIAVLRTDAALTPAARANLDDLRVGHLVLALGRDDDGSAAATFGVVSSVDGPWRTWRGGDVDRFIRPDLNMYSGFSGGPLVDTGGAVIGMNTWGLSRRMALTVPISTVARVTAQLLAGGRIKRGYLGVALQTVRLPDTLRAGHSIAQQTGAIVVDVAPGGPADRAGVMIGDVILALDAVAVDDSDELQSVLGTASVGTVKTVRILRAGEAREVNVTVGERPE